MPVVITPATNCPSAALSRLAKASQRGSGSVFNATVMLRSSCFIAAENGAAGGNLHPARCFQSANPPRDCGQTQERRFPFGIGPRGHDWFRLDATEEFARGHGPGDRGGHGKRGDG